MSRDKRAEDLRAFYPFMGTLDSSQLSTFVLQSETISMVLRHMMSELDTLLQNFKEDLSKRDIKIRTDQYAAKYWELLHECIVRLQRLATGIYACQQESIMSTPLSLAKTAYGQLEPRTMIHQTQ